MSDEIMIVETSGIQNDGMTQKGLANICNYLFSLIYFPISNNNKKKV